MPTASFLPRCPHRGAHSNPARLPLLLAVIVCGFAAAPKSLLGQDLLDYRLVVPAGHMQPWPDDEPEVYFAPAAPIRIATKWRTNLPGTRSKPAQPPTPEKEVAAQPVEKPPVEVPEPQVAPADESSGAVEDQLVQTPAADSTVAPMVESAPALEEVVEVADSPTAVEQALEVATTRPEVLAPPSQATGPQPLKAMPDPPDCYQSAPLSTINANIGLPTGSLPTNVAALCAAQHPPQGDPRLHGGWACTEHHWAATCMHHRPLYFEEINAERYGYTISYALQPVISAVRFFANIPALPYKMAVDCPRDCVFTLGYYRPGSCVPRRANRPPWSFRGAAVETGVIAGLILLLP